LQEAQAIPGYNIAFVFKKGGNSGLREMDLNALPPSYQPPCQKVTLSISTTLLLHCW